MSLAFSTERQVAITAVRRASSLASSVFNELASSQTLTKDDKSLVTTGDYAVQAVINTILGRAFPDDPIVGEESSEQIRGEENTILRTNITDLANAALTADIRPGDNIDWGIGPGQMKTDDELVDAIDRGNYIGGHQGRMWVLDPIDGTAGFLNGGQYAVCLALIVDGQVELGVIGCPNLPVKLSDPDGPRGALFVAVRGQGAEELTLDGENPVPLSISSSPRNRLTLVLPMPTEPPHWLESVKSRVSYLLHITNSPVRMISQVKYCALARGDGDVYMKTPSRSGWEMSIWDHAPGILLVQEAGGIVTNVYGQPLDFGHGRTLGVNLGLIAAGAYIHDTVSRAVQQALLEEDQERWLESRNIPSS